MKDLANKTVLVTGATDGIGRIAARRLAERGAAVLVHGRDQERIDETVAELSSAGGHDGVRGYRADYASLDEVRAMAAGVLDREPRLDVLINNAGIGIGGRRNGRRSESRDGHELRFQVNYLASVLLTSLLLPRLEASESARVVNVASAAQAPIDFDDLMLCQRYDGLRAYGQSKLALVMYTFDLARQLEPTRITANALHPGSLLDTKMVREGFGRPSGPPDEGAAAEVRLAASPELLGVSGCYFDGTRESRAHAQAYDPDARHRLRSLTTKLLA